MKVKILIIVLGSLMYGHTIKSCVIALTNDSNKPLLIVTDGFKEGMMLPAGGFVEFGSKDYMANFRVMEQKNKHFTQIYHAQQTACTPDKYTKLKISEITPGNTNIPFNISTIEKNDPPAQSSCGCKK